MKTHNIKTIPPYYEQIKSGLKTFELRLNDRYYKVGDFLNLMEYIPETKKYTGNVCSVRVVYILDRFQDALKENWVIMGIEIF